MNKAERILKKAQARQFFKDGKTYKEIGIIMGGIAISTLSGWCGDLAHKRLKIRWWLPNKGKLKKKN